MRDKFIVNKKQPVEIIFRVIAFQTLKVTEDLHDTVMGHLETSEITSLEDFLKVLPYFKNMLEPTLQGSLPLTKDNLKNTNQIEVLGENGDSLLEIQEL